MPPKDMRDVIPDVTGPMPGFLPGGGGPTRRRSRYLLVLLVLVSGYVLALEVSSLRYLGQPNAGFRFFNIGVDPAVVAVPLTRAAERATAGLEGPLWLLSANGQDVTDLHPFQFAHNQPQYLKIALGAKNRFLIRHGGDRTAEVTVPVQYPTMRVAVRNTHPSLLYKLVGYFYLLIGLLVWWLRPEDRAAGPLLLFSMVAMLNMNHTISVSPGTIVMQAVSLAFSPLWGVGGLYMAIHFVGCANEPMIRRLFRVLAALVFATSAVLFVSLPAALNGNSYAYLMLEYAVLVSGIELLSCVLVMVPLAWTATRSDNLQALRQRGKLFAVASGVAFIVPSLALVLQGLGVRIPRSELLILAFLATFPAIMGWAIVRHSMFDLRRAVRRGAVYAVLTLLVSLCYVGVVLLGLHIAASRAPSPLFMGISVGAMMLIFGLVQVRVLKAVDRFVYRTRYVYASALSRASEALSRERDLDGILTTVRGALVDAMGLSRVYMAVWEDEEKGRLRCKFVGGQGDKRARSAHPLPGRLKVGKVAPLARALSTRIISTTHDSTAVAAQSAGPDLGEHERPGRCEATFWNYHGMEAVIPLTTGRATTWPRVVGFLMLGPKRADLTLDQGDHEMLQTLGHQISVAVEHVETLEEIRRLNDNLERQVQERTQELSEALTDLKGAQQQLVEAGMQSAMGRLMAALLHEVNTPLGTMLSSVDMVERVLVRARKVLERAPEEGVDPEDPELRKVLRALGETGKLTEVLGSSGQRIKDVLDSLARFVSLDAAEVRLLDLERAVRDAVELLSPSLTDRIKVEVSFQEEIKLRCYPARMNRVFLNLLTNAADAIPDRGEIRVRARRDGERVEILVEDTGRGIEAEVLEHLFELGFTTRADGRVSMRLGLPSSKRWVEELGGELTVESREAGGTRIRVVLPMTPDLPPPA